MVFKLNHLRAVLILAFCMCLVGCNSKSNSSDSQIETVSLRQAWFTWAGYAGEVEAMKLDEKYGIELNVVQGADDIDPIKMVLSGENDFSITSPEALLLANEKGAELVAIGVINYKSPTCFVTLKDSGIESLKDFEGKRVGILTGSETETIYRILVDENNIDDSEIQEVEAAFDLSSYLVTDSYDVRPAFVFDELITLDDKGIDYNVIKPEDYGVELMGAVYFTTKKMIRENPKLVQSLVNSLAEGWEKTVNNPKEAIENLSDYDQNIDKERELKSLIKGMDYFRGKDNMVMLMDDDSWGRMAGILLKVGKVKKPLSYKESFNNSFIENFHANSKK